jgi:hypothetical protein
MARPRIGLFGALMALGGYLAIRYVQRNRSMQETAPRDLSRWEGEGGNVLTPVTPASGVAAASAGGSAHGANGSPYTNGNGGAWPFPRS